MGFLFRAYAPRPNYYHGYLQPGGTPNTTQPHYLHQTQYPHHGQYHGYDYLTQLENPEQYPYPNDLQYQQYNHYQQVPITYQPFIYDPGSEALTHSVDAQQSE